MSPSPTKAEALHALASRLGRSHVPPLLYWTVDDWRAYRAEILATACATFAAQRVAVRSATRHEDRPQSGCGGRYHSELAVAADPASLAAAIDRVVASYGDDAGMHHVLVQAMVADARRSGVVLTGDPTTGAAYDVVELAGGRATDTVTGGSGLPIRVAIHHDADPAVVAAAGLDTIVAATREVERIVAAPGPLELEVAERDDGTIALVQVRRRRPLPSATTSPNGAVTATLTRLTREVAAIARPTAAVAGTTTILGMMPDWNPAELIGAHPAPLAAALFRALISDQTWQEARATMGYQPVPATPLVHLVAGRPYVDVRASFNSFLPAGLAPHSRTALVDAWIAHLRRHPELHDRAELEVAQTAFDFTTVATVPERIGDRLTARASEAWLDALRTLTRRAIDGGATGSLAGAVRTLEASVVPAHPTPPLLRTSLAHLARCRRDGAHPFAIVARHAFMAEALLRSLVTRGAWSRERALAFRRSLPTVAGRFVADAERVAHGRLPPAALIATYGHLRPGAFDVTALPYARRDPSFWEDLRMTAEPVAPFVATPAETTAVTQLLAEARLDVEGPTLLAWMTAAIVGRDDGKFLFTRSLSAALEAFVAWGAARGLGREDLAWLTLTDLTLASVRDDQPTLQRLADGIASARARAADERLVRLGPLIRDAADLWVVHEPPVLPTFVTDRTVVAAPIVVDGRESVGRDVTGRIACVESADPGFDWIFGRHVGGLVTRFGGANSHMAIRCVELGVPAALGVGEHAFERLRRAPLIELRCAERAVRATDAHP